MATSRDLALKKAITTIPGQWITSPSPVANVRLAPDCRVTDKFKKNRSNRYEIVRPSSFFDMPSASSDLTSRSIDTVGSPASIFATRD